MGESGSAVRRSILLATRSVSGPGQAAAPRGFGRVAGVEDEEAELGRLGAL